LETTEKPKRSKAKHITGVIIIAIVDAFCIIGYNLATRQPHIELLNASREITDSKTKVTATLQNSGDEVESQQYGIRHTAAAQHSRLKEKKPSFQLHGTRESISTNLSRGFTEVFCQIVNVLGCSDYCADNLSFSRINISFHKNQGLPRAEFHVTINHRQRFVWRQKHRPQMRMSIRRMPVTLTFRNYFFEKNLNIA